jgi:tripartite-type tricarboxylate transporter receptor subunit TctC
MGAVLLFTSLRVWMINSIARTLTAVLFLYTATSAGWAQTPDTWQPKKPVEVVLMGAAGGGSERAVRFIVDIIKKHQLTTAMLTPTAKEGGAGVEAFSYFLKAPDPDHVLLMSARPFYMTAMRHPELKADISLFTPIAQMGVDAFILWVQGDRQDINTMDDFVKAVQKKKSETGQDWIMAGQWDDSEDSILTAMLNSKYNINIKYKGFPHGDDAGKQIVEKKADSTLNNPSELSEAYRQNKVKPIVAFSKKRLHAFPDTPTLIEAGYDFSHDMPRVIAGPPMMSPEAQLYYARLFKKVFNTQEWQEYREKSSLYDKFMTGPALTDHWQENVHARHRILSIVDVLKAMTSPTASTQNAKRK